MQSSLIIEQLFRTVKTVTIAEKDEKPCKQKYSSTTVHNGVTKGWPSWNIILSLQITCFWCRSISGSIDTKSTNWVQNNEFYLYG